MNKIRIQRETSRFILLLYLAVLSFSSFHYHASDQGFYGSESVSGSEGASKNHHSTTSYSACVMVVFSTTSSLVVNNYLPDSTESLLECIEFENNKFFIVRNYNVPLFRGPPVSHT
jgi:hypothetical protein